MQTLEERFWSKVNKTSTCWLWIASKRNNYGSFWYEGKTFKSNRFSYFLHFGYLPEDILVLHKCDNPLCVRPDHLFLGTTQDNIKDKIFKNRQAKGSINGAAKLTEDQVKEIKKELSNDSIGLKTKLAKKYGVHKSLITQISKNKIWKHI
jgi:hypothetical protein